MFHLRLNRFPFFWHSLNRSFLIGFLHFLTEFLYFLTGFLGFLAEFGFFHDCCSRLFDGFDEFILAVVFIRYFIGAIGIILSIFYEFPVADGTTYDLFEIIKEDFKRGGVDNKGSWFVFLEFLPIFLIDFELDVNHREKEFGAFWEVAFIEEAFF